jgi:hypothetical protein
VADQAGIPPRVKVGVILATLLLIVGIRLIDRHYNLFQEAAMLRIRIIERSLNLELSDAIAFRVTRFWLYVDWLYYLFAGATGLLGVFILYPDVRDVIAITFATAIVIAAIIGIGKSSRLKPQVELLDWRIDRLVVRRGEDVHITLTNLNKGPLPIESGVVWSVVAQGNIRSVIHEEKSDTAITIPGDDSYTWTLGTKKIPPGIYRVLPFNRGEVPLKTKIRIT